jgi:hypothetical protein
METLMTLNHWTKEAFDTSVRHVVLMLLVVAAVRASILNLLKQPPAGHTLIEQSRDSDSDDSDSDSVFELEVDLIVFFAMVREKSRRRAGMMLSVAAQINDCNRKIAKVKFARKSCVKWDLQSNMVANHSIGIFEVWSLETWPLYSTYSAVGEDEYTSEILKRRYWDGRQGYMLIRQDFVASEVGDRRKAVVVALRRLFQTKECVSGIVQADKAGRRRRFGTLSSQVRDLESKSAWENAATTTGTKEVRQTRREHHEWKAEERGKIEWGAINNEFWIAAAN